MMSLPTPDISHACSDDWSRIYEPSEDTFLLLDALEQDLDFIKSKQPTICLEVGSGSGIVICGLSMAYPNIPLVLATDINPFSVKFIKKTSIKNFCRVEVIQMDLMATFRHDQVDMIIFNPPYVVTPSEEISGRGLERAWAGGIKGREVTDKFIDQLNACLSKNGFGYILLLEENCPDDVVTLLNNLDFQCKFILERKIRGEKLYVVRFYK